MGGEANGESGTNGANGENGSAAKAVAKTEVKAISQPAADTTVVEVKKVVKKEKPLVRGKTFWQYGPFDDEGFKTVLDPSCGYKPSFVARWFDNYAEKVSLGGHPDCTTMPVTTMGGIFSIIFGVTILFQVYGTLNKFSDETMILEPLALEGFGDRLQLNIPCVYKPGEDPDTCVYMNELEYGFDSTKPPQEWLGRPWNILDLPAVDVSISHVLEFYEREEVEGEGGKTALSRIEVQDNTQILTGVETGVDEVPVGFAAREKMRIPMNSYPNVTGMRNPEEKVVERYALAEMKGASMTHAFDETLKFVYARNDIFGSYKGFFDHEVHVFARYDPSQMNFVKSCSFQIGMMNAGERQGFSQNNSLRKYNRHYMKKQYLSSLTTTNRTWSPNMWNVARRYDDKDSNMIHLTATFTELRIEQLSKMGRVGPAKIDPVSISYPESSNNMTAVDGVKVKFSGETNYKYSEAYNDWIFFASYVNNFVRTAEVTECDDHPNIDYQWGEAELFSETDTVITVKGIKALGTKENPVFKYKREDLPFFAIASGDAGKEKIKVVDFEVEKFHPTAGAVGEHEAKFFIERGFGRPVLDFKIKPPSMYPPAPTEAWTCHPSLYLDGARCDCNCGEMDPDCLTGTGELFHCSERDGEYCSPVGRCTIPGYPAKKVAISMPCHTLLMSGDTVLHGYFGHGREFEETGGKQCEACPYDATYEGKSNRDDKSNWVCNYVGIGSVDARQIVGENDCLIGAECSEDCILAEYPCGPEENTNFKDSNYTLIRVLDIALGARSALPILNLTGTKYDPEIDLWEPNENQTDADKPPVLKTRKKPYTVALNKGYGNEELVKVIRSNVPNERNVQRVVIIPLAKGMPFRNKHFAIGQVASAMTGDWTDMVLEVDWMKNFPKAGPFRLQVDSSVLMIRAGSDLSADMPDTDEEDEDERRARARALRAQNGAELPDGEDEEEDGAEEAAGEEEDEWKGSRTWEAEASEAPDNPGSWSDEYLKELKEKADAARVLGSNWHKEQAETRARSRRLLLSATDSAGVRPVQRLVVQPPYPAGLAGTGTRSPMTRMSRKFMPRLRAISMPPYGGELTPEQKGAIRMSKVDIYVPDGSCFEDHYLTGEEDGLFKYEEIENVTESSKTVRLCDGIPDGDVVVKAADFNSVKKGARLLIRSVNPSDISEMEVRELFARGKNEPVSRFGFPDPRTGKKRVKEWGCKSVRFGDGICDCNCGRFDPDCAGSMGNISAFVQQLETGLVKIRLNCGKNSKKIRMPELRALEKAGVTEETSVTCGELKKATRKRNTRPLNVAKYGITDDPLYCSFYDGASTTDSRFMNYRTPVGQLPSSEDWNGTDPVLKPGEDGKYWEDKLWEVLSLNEGLRFNHGVGAIVETLNVVKSKKKRAVDVFRVNLLWTRGQRGRRSLESTAISRLDSRMESAVRISGAWTKREPLQTWTGVTVVVVTVVVVTVVVVTVVTRMLVGTVPVGTVPVAVATVRGGSVRGTAVIRDHLTAAVVSARTAVVTAAVVSARTAVVTAAVVSA
jgi:hypothetical protein